jgi:hypothetical protein
MPCKTNYQRGEEMKYIDLIAYPAMLGVVYVLFGFINWDSNPANWTVDHRSLWVVWGLAWGWALALRIRAAEYD